MTAALNFLKNVGLSIGAFVVLYFFLMIWCVAAVFHGVNYVTRGKR